jgi:hypothetical protein
MANRTTVLSFIVGVGLWLAAISAPVAAFAGSCCSPPTPPASCGCTPPPCCSPPSPPSPPQCCSPTTNVVVPGVNVFVAAAVNVQVNASANAASFAGAQTQTIVGGGGGGSMIGPGPVSSVNLDVGGMQREAYEAERTRYEKVVIQAFCFDDKDVPHPASQTSADRDIDEMFEGELYRCIAGTHMQVTIAAWAEKISFEGGKTLTCAKNEALYHVAGKGGGKLECRTQVPARDCNERSLLRRFGAGIKVLTLVMTEKYTAYREERSQSASQVMMLDGGVGGVVY